MKKRIFCMLLLASMVIGCFAGCNSPEKDPIDSTEQSTESQSEGETTGETESETETESESESATSDEWLLERRKRSSSSVTVTEREIILIDQLPGTEIPYRVLSTKGSSSQSGATIFTEEEARDALAAVDIDANTVDFENEIVVCVATSGGAYEALSIELHKLLLLEQPADRASTPPCMLFVYTTNYPGVGDGMSMRYTTYLAISKSALPQKHLQYLICGYSTEISGLGTAHMFPLFPEDVSEYIEKVYFPQEEIPGTRLEYRMVGVGGYLMNVPRMLTFETKAEFQQYIEAPSRSYLNAEEREALCQMVDQVNFETDCLIVVTAHHTSSGEPFTLEDVILQKERLVFVYHSNIEITEDIITQNSFLTVKKSDLSKENLDSFICAYCREHDGVGSYFYRNYYEYQ